MEAPVLVIPIHPPCAFYHKIGACRHGVRCPRRHVIPTRSRTLLFPNFYDPVIPPADPIESAMSTSEVREREKRMWQALGADNESQSNIILLPPPLVEMVCEYAEPWDPVAFERTYFEEFLEDFLGEFRRLNLCVFDIFVMTNIASFLLGNTLLMFSSEVSSLFVSCRRERKKKEEREGEKEREISRFLYI